MTGLIVPVGRRKEFVKFKAVFTHAELDLVQTRFCNLQENFKGFPAMNFLCALPAFPVGQDHC